MSEIVIEHVHSILNINSHSHIQYAPFSVIENLVYIEKIWWEQIRPELRIKIIISFGDYFGYAVRDEIPKNARKEGEAFERFLKAFQSIFSVNNWAESLEGYSISIIDQNGIGKLTKISLEEIETHCQPILISSVKKYLEMHKETGIFMRMDNGHVTKRCPKFTLEHVIAEIICNPKATILFMCPWRYEIAKNGEYRVFVYDGHVSAISQKECYKYEGLTFDKITTITKTIRQYILKLNKRIPYLTYVADIWATTNVSHLIKVLPGESWTSTESCLFNWEVDCKKLTQKEKTYVKYIDIQSPMIRPLSGTIDNLVLN